jgi:hypothetical protein
VDDDYDDDKVKFAHVLYQAPLFEKYGGKKVDFTRS